MNNVPFATPSLAAAIKSEFTNKDMDFQQTLTTAEMKTHHKALLAMKQWFKQQQVRAAVLQDRDAESELESHQDSLVSLLSFFERQHDVPGNEDSIAVVEDGGRPCYFTDSSDSEDDDDQSSELSDDSWPLPPSPSPPMPFQKPWSMMREGVFLSMSDTKALMSTICEKLSSQINDHDNSEVCPRYRELIASQPELDIFDNPPCSMIHEGVVTWTKRKYYPDLYWSEFIMSRKGQSERAMRKAGQEAQLEQARAALEAASMKDGSN